jgi:hypothetical protein
MATPEPIRSSLSQTVHLDGAGSSDANGDALTYSWSFVSRPRVARLRCRAPPSSARRSSLTVSAYVSSAAISDAHSWRAARCVTVRSQDDHAGARRHTIVGAVIRTLTITISPACGRRYRVAVSSDDTNI